MYIMKQLYTVFTAVILFTGTLTAQNDLEFTIDEVIELAKEQSPEGLLAKHSFRASYWQYRSYKAGFLPSLVFAATAPNFSRAMTAVQQENGTYLYLQDYSNRLSGAINIEQNVPLTGGQITLGSNLSRTDIFGDDGYVQYLSSPLSVTYSQSLFGLNNLKWDKKIEPLRYEEARKRYLRAVENVAIVAVRYFFNLAEAQQRVAIAEFNKANNDSLYKISRGRYNIGTIGENDMLQSELNYMNACATLNDAILNLAASKNRLRSFLGFNESVNISIVIPSEAPKLDLNEDKVMELAKANSPDLIGYERQLIEAQRSVASAKASRGFSADLYMQFGLDQRSGTRQSSGKIADAYKKPGDMERVQLGLRIPILDWGKGKGRVKMAQSNQELTKVQILQAITDFEQDVILQVNQYNMQAEQYQITTKADTIAQKRYTVSMQRYLTDKIDITEMNNAQNDRDNARLRSVSALRNYWTYYYTIRQLTLYDLLSNKPLETDYDKLIE
ncbi:MAG: TolC family protein [Prevotellaceae bacterium]|nr:TolC family protein [Prevotellaceae bacterium]